MKSALFPTLIKVDVEGAGNLGLRGAAKSLSYDAIWFCSFHITAEQNGMKATMNDSSSRLERILK